MKKTGAETNNTDKKRETRKQRKSPHVNRKPTRVSKTEACTAKKKEKPNREETPKEGRRAHDHIKGQHRGKG